MELWVFRRCLPSPRAWIGENFHKQRLFVFAPTFLAVTVERLMWLCQ